MRNDDAIVGYQGMSVEESLQVSHDVDRFQTSLEDTKRAALQR